MTVDVLVKTADASKYGILFSGISAVVYVYALMFVCVPSPKLRLWPLSAVLLCVCSSADKYCRVACVTGCFQSPGISVCPVWSTVVLSDGCF